MRPAAALAEPRYAEYLHHRDINLHGINTSDAKEPG